MVNQTVSIPQEPENKSYVWKNIIEYKVPSESDLSKFEQAVASKDKMRTD